MKATTIKLDGELLQVVESVKPKNQSLTAYVRSVLQREIQRQTMLEAATHYNAFLATHPDEKAWMDEWDAADLANPARRRKAS